MRRWMIATAVFCLSGGVLASSNFDRLTGLDGQAPALDSRKAQRLVVFWGTWCDECRAKLGKELVELDRRADVSVVTVNADRDDDRVRAFVAKEHVALPVLRDPTREFRRELKVFSVPHWALYRKKDQAYVLVESEAAFEYDHILQALARKSP